MIRITDQYFWNFVFSAFFIALTIMGAIILQTEAYRPVETFTLADYALVTLTTFRLIRLFIYDAITKFFREQFWDAKTVGRGIVLEKPASGPRRTLADLLGCPWCLGVWLAALVTFAYAMFPIVYYFTVFLAIAGVATAIQIGCNLLGHSAERCKLENERLK